MHRKKPSSKTNKRTPGKIPPGLTDIERDLLSHMENGYELETDSLGGNLVLHKGDELIRPASANRNTVMALQERGLIGPGKSREPLTIVWRTRKSTA